MIMSVSYMSNVCLVYDHVSYVSHVCLLRYNTSANQAVFEVNSGPWIFKGCDVGGANVVCFEVSSEGWLLASDCVLGGTGRRLHKEPGGVGTAHMGVNALMNAHVSLKRCVLKDIGLDDGMGVNAAQSSTGVL